MMASKAQRKQTSGNSGPSTAPAPNLNGLRVLVPSKGDDYQALQPGQALFDCTASVASLALDLLEVRNSIVALKTITTKVLESNPHDPVLRSIKETDIESKVGQFLRAIRASFPHVVISNKYGMDSKNGRTTKRDCQGTFEPKRAAVVELNGTLMNRLAAMCNHLKATSSATTQRRFHNLHFRLSVTTAHELVHVFNLYLRRGQYQHTPPHVTYGPYGNDKVGESGRYWENIFLGGYVDMRKSPDGVETVALCDAQRTCWSIRSRAIDGILSRDFADWFPSGTALNDVDHPKITKEEPVTDRMSSLTWKTGFADVFPSTAQPGGSQEPERIPDGQITRLTGPEILKTRKYNVCGEDLRSFAQNPTIVLRYSVA